jgi:Helix-turn-helix domain
MAAPRAPRVGSRAAPEAPFALGAWLARQRELRGIRLEELSALTRLPLRSLERLEAGVYDGHQDGFVRGFVRTVAIAIGLDPEDAVARLLAEPATRPRRRWPDPRRVGLAALGLASTLAAAVALWQWVHAPPAERLPAVDGPVLRRDPVRALALEHGLLDEDGAGADTARTLRLEAAPEEPEAEAAPGALAEPAAPAPPAP